MVAQGTAAGISVISAMCCFGTSQKMHPGTSQSAPTRCAAVLFHTAAACVEGTTGCRMLREGSHLVLPVPTSSMVRTQPGWAWWYTFIYRHQGRQAQTWSKATLGMAPTLQLQPQVSILHETVMHVTNPPRSYPLRCPLRCACW